MKFFRRLYRYFGPQGWWPADSSLEVALGAILTQNTSWSSVQKAISSLKSNGLLDIQKLKKIPKNTLASTIRQCRYYNIKAERIKTFVEFIYKNYSGNIDSMFLEQHEKLREEILSISGIGEETTDSIMLYAGDIPVFVCDAYTRRIFSRMGIFENTIKYSEMQRFFMDRLPEDAELFKEYHAQVVQLAKKKCRKVPLCDGCPIKDMCDLAICGKPPYN